MTLREALANFGNKKVALANALGISKQAVNRWSMDSPIPENRARQLKYEVLPDMKSEEEP